ncbi:nose resistant to fluoxetine protein 6-like [Uloborus diversus]|uniref:nose resistant to fluoxetine protein 6-like n=1 Tax=Uloborus diversus TaxID=327109 RepID=UPI002409246C|nr:nose resistant to fluoxetine protein 6-like [Uloborus diversus]
MNLVWIFLITLLKHSCADELVSSTEGINDTLIYEKWMAMDAKLKSSVSSAMSYFFPFSIKLAANVNVSSVCAKQGLQLINGINRLEVWALSFADASGKIVDGLLSSSSGALGDYSQCLNSASSGKKEGGFQGQYCMLSIKPPLPAPKKEYFRSGIKELKNYTRSASEMIRSLASKAQNFYVASLLLGVCVPSGCSTDDIDSVAKYAFSEAYLDAHIEYCETKIWMPLETRSIIAITVYTTLGLLMLIGTMSDLLLQEKKFPLKGKAARMVVAFSFPKNTRELLRAETSSDSIPCLHGLRFLTLTWIISSHTTFFIVRMHQMHQNFDEIIESFKGFGMQIIVNFLFSVETFFLLGGLLNCYACVKDEQKKKSRSLFYSIKHRLWRILPAYAAILVCVFLIRRLMSGPAAGSDVGHFLDSTCKVAWWQNFLFINNYTDFENTCLPHSWYLSAEMQLFLIACVTIRILLRYPTMGLILNFSMMLISAAYSIYWTAVHGNHATLLLTYIDPKQFNLHLHWYNQSMVHAGSYFLGVLVGYVLAKKKEVKISKVPLFLGWLLATFMATWVVFASKKWNEGTEPTQLEDLFYAGFSKTAFSLSVAWVVTCCARGYGGIINRFLSWRVWIPLSRLAFCMYLVSPIVQLLSIGSSKTVRDSTPKEWVWRFFGDYFVSAFLAFLFFVLVENPFITIERIFNEKDKSEMKVEQKNATENGDQIQNNSQLEVRRINNVITVSAL